jgi:hypothetical protein
MTRLAPLALGALTLTAACDLALAPDTAEGAGVHPARIAVLLGSDVTNMPTEITAVEVEVFDLRVHRSSDDTWVMLAPEAVRVDIVEQDVTPAHDGIPCVPITTMRSSS